MYAGNKPLPDDLQADKELVMAVKELKRVNSDERTRAILEQRDKEERIRITQINEALRQGRDEERVSVVMKMFGEGLEISLISKVTGLSRAEIEALKKTPGADPAKS